MTTLLVIAKEPRPGRVKTRLTPPFTPEEAAALAEAALADTLRAVAAAPARRRVLVLDGQPGPWLPPGFDVVPQCAGGLDERLAAAFAGCDGPALLIGMDTPQVTPGLLTVDFDGLRRLLRPGRGRRLLGARAGGPGPGAAARGADVDARHRRRPARPARRRRPAGARPAAPAGRGHGRRRRSGRRPGAARLLRRGTGPAADGRPPMSTAHEVIGAGPPPAHSWSADPYADALRAGRDRSSCAAPTAGCCRWRWSAGVRGPTPRTCRSWTGARVPSSTSGAGPGRLVAELAARGRPALGIDVSEAAVARTLRLGGPALWRSVFEPLPGEGRWDTALLLDGNLGIGGDPRALLRRTGRTPAPGGLLIAETAPVDVDERVEVRIVRAAATGGRPAPRSPGPGSAPRRCCGTPTRSAGAPPISGRQAAGPSSPCAAAAPAAAAQKPPNSTAVISSQRARKPSPDSPVADS